MQTVTISSIPTVFPTHLHNTAQYARRYSGHQHIYTDSQDQDDMCEPCCSLVITITVCAVHLYCAMVGNIILPTNTVQQYTWTSANINPISNYHVNNTIHAFFRAVAVYGTALLMHLWLEYEFPTIIWSSILMLGWPNASERLWKNAVFLVWTPWIP